MLETGFLSAALAFIGIMPAREIKREPFQFDLALMPVEPVARPTMTASPQQVMAPVPAEPASPMAAMPDIHATSHAIDVSSLARIPDMPAITFFIEEWIEYGVEHAASLDALVRDYKAMRETHSFLPPVSKKRLSQLLAKHGCRKFISDERDREGQRHRVVFFELRQSLKANVRRAA